MSSDRFRDGRERAVRFLERSFAGRCVYRFIELEGFDRAIALASRAFIAVIPLYVVGLLTSYLATRSIATGYFGQSTGTYDYYFHLFLPPEDVLAGIDAVTVEEVQRVAEDVIGQNGLKLALIGPFDDTERFEKVLAG